MAPRAASTVRGRGAAASALGGRRGAAAGPTPSLKKEGKASGTAASSRVAKPTPSHHSAGATAVDAEAVARKVLRLGEAGDHEAILRVLGDPVDSASGAAAARKAFLRISLVIHPDKLPNFPEATKAFQALVTAFDRSQGTGAPVNVSAPTKHAAIARSNDGCFRTEVLCPKCKVPWGKAVEGNPDYYYNFMMEGLRCFTCGTCMTTFGCLTAIHKCPLCKEPFEYHPDLFHQKVTCGNPGCGKRFGFHMFQASERALNAAREAVREEFERRSRAEDSRTARARRASRRYGDADEEGIAEAAFAMGLRDTCPRCGLDMTEYEDGEQLRHLRTCTDTEVHREHKERQRSRATASEAARKKEQAQHSIASSALWSISGGQASQLWMLDTDQLKKRCSQAGLAVKGSREALIERLVEHLASKKGGKGKHLAVCLPEDLHALSDSQLAAVCAAHHLKGLSSRSERLHALEELQIDGPEGVAPSLPAIEGRSKASAIEDRGVKRKPSAMADSQVLAIEDQREPKPKAKAGPKSKAKAKAKAKKAAFWGKGRKSPKG